MDLIHALQAFASPALDALMLAVTNLGSERAYIVFLLVAYLAVDAKIGQRLSVALLVSFYLNFQLKGVFDTPRPYVLEPAVARSDEAILTGPGAGFPSGHAQGGASFWVLAAVYARRGWFWALALAVVVLISLSRMYLGLHLPVDVLGGLLIGLSLVLAAYLAFRRLEKLDRLPLALVLSLGLLVPLALHLLLPVNDSDLLLGGLAAFLTGPWLVPYRVPSRWWQRALLALLGVVLALSLLTASSLLLSDAVKDHPLGGFLRYLLLGYAGVLLVPALGRALGWVHAGARHAATAQADA